MRGAILASAKSFPGRLFVYPYPVSGAERSEPSQTDNLNPGAAMGSRDSRIWLGCLVFGLAACLFYLVVEIYLLGGELGFPLDDSWIHLQFARNLFAGNGLSFNPEVLVPGSTAPLWTALLSLIFFLPGNPLFWTKLFGVVLYLAGGVVTYRLSRELGLDPWPANLAAAVTLATSWLVWSALSGSGDLAVHRPQSGGNSVPYPGASRSRAHSRVAAHPGARLSGSSGGGIADLGGGRRPAAGISARGGWSGDLAPAAVARSACRIGDRRGDRSSGLGLQSLSHRIDLAHHIWSQVGRAGSVAAGDGLSVYSVRDLLPGTALDGSVRRCRSPDSSRRSGDPEGTVDCCRFSGSLVCRSPTV